MTRASGVPVDRDTGLFDPKPRDLVIRDLVNRSRRRFDEAPDGVLENLLEDALWHERKRLERKPDDPEHAILDDLAHALVRGGRSDRTNAGLRLVGTWADEIHGRFDPRVYQFATRMLPRGLSALLSGRSGRMRDWRPLQSAETRIQVRGPLPLLHELSREATLVLAPTHVSNLDSPLVGLVLYLAGLPPFVYGAGLNLFSNPIIGWWMHRLGAYTVDRTKKSGLYKDVLKDYSVRALTTRHHSLFFPGGTRARSGEIEPKLKKGLLGTVIVAWQEMLAARRPDSEIYIVPCTLSMSLVLEAATLIEDFLAESGKQRYIISDDEFAQPRQLAAFANRVLDLDSAVVARFGQPLDVFGNVVSADPAERAEQARRRRGYVTGRDGKVEWDEQRDHVYTERLAASLCEAFVTETEVLATNIAAAAAWNCVARSVGSTDPFRVVRSPIEQRRIASDVYRVELGSLLDRVRASAAAGRGHVTTLEDSVDGVLATALDRFGRYHRSRALVQRGSELVVEDPKLCFYYRNRLTWLDRPSRARPLGEVG